MNDKPFLSSSRIITFTYKHFFPIIAGIILLDVNDFILFRHTTIIILFILVVVYALLNYFIFNIDFYEDYIVIYRFFRKKRISYEAINNVYQTRFIAPKLIFLTLKNKFFFRFVVFMVAPKDTDILLIKDEPIVKYIKERLKP